MSANKNDLSFQWMESKSHQSCQRELQYCEAKTCFNTYRCYDGTASFLLGVTLIVQSHRQFNFKGSNAVRCTAVCYFKGDSQRFQDTYFLWPFQNNITCKHYPKKKKKTVAEISEMTEDISCKLLVASGHQQSKPIGFLLSHSQLRGRIYPTSLSSTLPKAPQRKEENIKCRVKEFPGG